MSVVRCESGLHFYDNEKFDECPHCAREKNMDKGERVGSDINYQSTMAAPDIDANVINTVGLMELMPSIEEKFRVDNVDDNVTIAFHSPVKGNDFIVGWLVCIEGPEKGRDYRIFHGINKLGRSDDMDIVIKDDMTISREKVCSVVYDMKTNKYYLMPAVNGFIYVNGEIVQESIELKTGDNISMGQSTFMFVAFCTDDWKWE